MPESLSNVSVVLPLCRSWTGEADARGRGDAAATGHQSITRQVCTAQCSEGRDWGLLLTCGVAASAIRQVMAGTGDVGPGVEHFN